MSKAASADFTVRDLNRRPAQVLAACDRVGTVTVRSRAGDVYEIRRQPLAKKNTGKEKTTYPDYAVWRKSVGMPRMTKAQSAHLDRMIRGE